jgi:2-iminobutanoate/2-iminopropanoate deaminase
MTSLRLLLLASFLALPALAESTIERFKGDPWEDDIGYRQAVRVGNILYISGWAGGGTMPDAIRGTYDSLGTILKKHGLTFKDVVKENLYTTDLEAVKANLGIRRAYYGEIFPAATWVQVARLYDADHVFEVELIAVFPE